MAHRAAPDELRFVVHATTVATNAVLERRGAVGGLLVTRGFRDILEIGRQIRYELYNLQTDKPPALIPRERCLEITERLGPDGEVLVPIDETSVARAVEVFRMQGVTSIAVCFLHAYQNPIHERRARDAIRQLYPEAAISLSSEIAPEIREYWRASTTVVNAYIARLVRAYLGAIEQKVHTRGIGTNVHIMQSSGGIMTIGTARERPVLMLESGPAAGVAAAAYFAGLVGCQHAISFDMGGTTAKMGLILDGQARVVSEFEVGSAAGSGAGLAKGSGYPVLAPVVDLVEVGAGGGSIAWIDSGGLLRVGPRSAGAEPGPACYARGGTEPTITDANLALGRLNPRYFLGGEMPLDETAAKTAIERCARPLGLDRVTAANGIIDIANASMVEAMRLVSIQRGHDPTEFSLVAFGGAGPLHANRLADELGIPTVVVPPSPGVASALGMLVSDLRHDYRLTRLQLLTSARVEELNHIFHEFEKQGRAALGREGVPDDRMKFRRYVDMRYVGQSWKLTIDVPAVALTAEHIAPLKEAFDRYHEQSYGYCVPDEPAEIVNIGLLAIGDVPKPRLEAVSPRPGSEAQAYKGSRPVYFAESGGFVDCRVFERAILGLGAVIPGPAVIEEPDSTILIHPGYFAEVVQYGILILRRMADHRAIR
jgi:N-methylhydantoinase A